MSSFFILCGLNPWEILAQSNDVKDINGLDIGGLVYVLRRGAVIVCFLAIASSIIVLMASQNATKTIEEQKKNIQHKLIVLWLVGAIVILFDAMKNFFDLSFGL